jgi:O-glycosyl hydrolase
LDAKGLSSVGIAASDETSIDLAVDTYNALSASARGQTAQINTHAYSGSKRKELLALATRDMKRLWSSEVDGSGAPAPFDVYAHNHADIVPGLDLANRITRDLKELRPHAWVFWQAVENEAAQVSLNKNWGLLHTDFTGQDQSHAVTKKYHAFSQYTRAIRPGYQQIDASQSDAVAFFGGGTLVIVQRNATTSDSTYSYDLSSFATVGSQATVHRTSASENYAALPAVCIANKKLVFTSARQSITTFVIAGSAL